MVNFFFHGPHDRSSQYVGFGGVVNGSFILHLFSARVEGTYLTAFGMDF